MSNVATKVKKSIPEDWAKLGVSSDFDPLPLGTSRILLLYEQKDGVTTFTRSRPNTLILDFEDAARSVRPEAIGPNNVYLPIKTYAKLDEVIKKLGDDFQRGKRRFETVVFDTVDRMLDIIEPQLSIEKRMDIHDYGGGKGGYAVIRNRVVSFPRQLYLWGYGWQCNCHQRWTSDSGGAQYLRSCVYPGIIDALKQDADYITQLNSVWKKVQVPNKDNPRVKTTKYVRRVELHTTNQEGSDYSAELGTRIPLPEVLTIPLKNGFQVVTDAWAAEVQRLKG